MEDTICAIATSLGISSISIIRVSGKDSIKIVNKIFSKDLNKVKANTINYGKIIYNKEIIDEVLVSVFHAPKSFTAENVVEINLHGGIAATNKVLEILLLSGCRMALPGEFSKRAFLNGRIDLIEAESISDIISSESEAQRKMAVSGISGNLSELIKKNRENLVSLIANIEVNIDYPEYEDALEITRNNINPMLLDIKKSLTNLVETSGNGKIVKNGLNIALVGKPNVGKSSILNKLLDEEKAIVTDIAGTTRDVVEGTITLNGIKINLIDTAGIRNTNNIVEKIGVEKSKKIINNCDLAVLVLDGSSNITKEDKELLKLVSSEKSVVFINKNDLSIKCDLKDAIIGNTKTIDGLDTLKNKIIELFNLEKISSGDLNYLSNAREISLVKKALESINAAIKNNQNDIPIDMIEIDIKNAWNYLGEIIGANYNEELLNELFSKFCLGK